MSSLTVCDKDQLTSHRDDIDGPPTAVANYSSLYGFILYLSIVLRPNGLSYPESCSSPHVRDDLPGWSQTGEPRGHAEIWRRLLPLWNRLPFPLIGNRWKEKPNMSCSHVPPTGPSVGLDHLRVGNGDSVKGLKS